MTVISYDGIDEFVYNKIHSLINNGYKINAKQFKYSEFLMEAVLDDVKCKDSNISVKIIDKFNKDTRDISFIVMYLGSIAYTINKTFYKINDNLYTDNKDSVYLNKSNTETNDKNKFNKKDNVNSNYTSTDHIDHLFDNIIF